MKKRHLLLLTATTLLGGCALLSILAFPIKLLFSVLGGIGSGLSGLVTSVEPLEGPAPELAPEAPGRWAVASIHPQSRFRVVFEAAGHEPRAYTWPDDFPGASAGTIEIDVVLRPLPDSAIAGLPAYGSDR